MQNYIVTAPFIQINPGAIIGLKDDQLKGRSYAIKKAGKERYEVINPFHMKMGENFMSEELIDKKFAHMIIEEKSFKKLPVAEQIKDFNRPLLLKFVKENCKGIKEPLPKKNDDLKNQIVEFMTAKKKSAPTK